MDLDLSVNSIISGLIFSAIGIYFLKYGKRESEPKLLVIGLVLMGYSLFVPNHALNWAIGIALTGWGWWEVKGKYT